MSTLIVTHGSCSDGFTAAWIANMYAKQNGEEYEFVECNYNDPKNASLVERMRGKDVRVFDFSFPRPMMREMFLAANTMMVFDHHASAQADCEGLTYCVFDLTKSGAMLAWDHYFPGMPALPLVQYVQDRDLWKFELPDSRAINAVIGSYERNFKNWTDLSVQAANGLGFREMTASGNTILRIQAGVIKKKLSFASTIELMGYRVPFLNLTDLISEVLADLCVDQPFAASFFLRQDGAYVFSLRSKEFDVSKVAKFYDGGGHKNAAGFTVTLEGWIMLARTIEERK